MFTFPIFLFFLFILNINSSFYVTFFDYEKENFQKLKHNIGYLHQNFDNISIIIVVEIYNHSSVFQKQIIYWENVHVIDIQTIFLKKIEFSNINDLHKFGILKYCSRNYLLLNDTKLFFFDNSFDLDAIEPSIKTILQNPKPSISEIHMSLQKTHVEMLHQNLLHNTLNDIVQIYKQNLIYRREKEFTKNTYGCLIRFKDYHLSSLYQKFISDKPNQKTIAILIPSIYKSKNLTESPFFKVTFPSLTNTILKNETEKFRIKFFFGIDDDDLIIKNPELKKLHMQTILNAFKNSVSVQYLAYPSSKSVVFLWNSLFTEAYHQKYNIFLQLNDDTEIFKAGWLTKVFNIFENGFDGLIGFNDITWKDCKIITQAFVSSSHFIKNNGSLYPSVFKNTMSDIWLTEFYAKNSICLTEFTADNHFSKTRYERCPFNRELLKKFFGRFEKKYIVTRRNRQKS